MPQTATLQITSSAEEMEFVMKRVASGEYANNG